MILKIKELFGQMAKVVVVDNNKQTGGTNMKKKIGSSNHVLTGALVLGLSLVSTSAFAAPDWAKDLSEIEKCGGVAKKGKNDCGTKNHDCGGKAKSNNLADEWVYTPVGVCDKVGGKVLTVKKLKS